jgi:DNA-binding IclR family transcriptional regulator
LVTLSETLLATTELRREARTIMEELAAQYQETIQRAQTEFRKAILRAGQIVSERLGHYGA